MSGLAPRSASPTARRHPGDILRAVLAAVLLVALTYAVAGGEVSASEAAAFRVFNDLPRVLSWPVQALLVLGSPVVGGGLAFVGALALRQLRLAWDLVVGSALSYGLARAIKEIVHRAGPAAHSTVIGHVSTVWVPTGFGASTGFPSAVVAVVAALATCAGPYLRRPASRALWLGVALVAAGGLYAGADLPLGVLAGGALGWLVGALLNLAWGAPTGHPSLSQVRRALGEAGVQLRELAPAGMGGRSYVRFVATDSSGEELFVKVLGREERSVDLLVRLWRFVAFRGIQDEVSLVSRKRQVEHEALMAMMAAQGGVRTPGMRLAARGRRGETFLVEERVAGRTLDDLPEEELDDKLLRRVWEQVLELRACRIAHRDLRRHNILVDGCGQPWLLDFGVADASASPQRLARDVAELLVSLAAVVGAERAASSACETLGSELLMATLPVLQPLALSGRTLRELRTRRSVIGEIRERLVAHTGEDAPPLEQITRLHPRTLLAVIAGGVAIFVLLPQVGHFRATVGAIESARWWWLLGTVGAAAATYVSAALAQMGAVTAKLRLSSATLVQVACSFTNRVTPAGLGGLGLNERFLEASGIKRASAVRAVGLNALAGAVVHTIGVVVAIAILGKAGIGGVSLPRGWGILVAVVAVLGIIGVVLATPLRRRIGGPLRRAARDLVLVLRRPPQAAKLFIGSAGVTVGNALALAASLDAFDAHVGLAKVMVVYLGGAAVAAVSPTPGNLGAVEAALVAGLTGIGVAAGPAVAGVLAFRLVTFWLPTAPGFWAFRVVQRRKLA
ncbi:MAG: lysylphosphatidylglycerol synthase domain-containing protein [Acidimicrobiales bacterium]